MQRWVDFTEFEDLDHLFTQFTRDGNLLATYALTSNGLAITGGFTFGYIPSVILWTGLGSFEGDIDVCIGVSYPGTGGTSYKGGPLVHAESGPGLWGSNESSGRGYLATHSTTSNQGRQLWRITAGATTTLQTQNVSYTTNQRQFIYIQRIGTTIRAKFWDHRQVMPSSWSLSVTDENHNSGYVGIHTGHENMTSTWTWLSVGTDGDPALIPPGQAKQTFGVWSEPEGDGILLATGMWEDNTPQEDILLRYHPDLEEGEIEVYLRASADFGKTWTDDTPFTIKVDSSEPGIIGTIQVEPEVVTPGGD